MEKSARGFTSMNDDKQTDTANKNNQSQNPESNSGSFANYKQKASRAGKKGGKK